MSPAAIIILCSIVALTVGIIIFEIVKKVKGKSSCGGNCAGCSMSCSCHKDETK